MSLENTQRQFGGKMKQVIQDYRSGALRVEEVATPALRGPGYLVATRASLISSGTERATIELSRSSLAGKAAKRPDLVRKVVQAAQRDGIVETARLVQRRLDSWAALGYSSAGIVSEVCCDGSAMPATALKPGQRVACAGQNYASHAQAAFIPQNLCVPIPGPVSFAQASFVAVGSIALQSVRQLAPALGECVGVVGLGLVGQLVARLLAANGCHVVAIDLDPRRAALAAQAHCAIDAGSSDFCERALARTAGCGLDGVIVAAASRSDGPLRDAAVASRKRGRIVLLGDVPISASRDVFYHKELELKLSTSYGPGRYDDHYELEGHDYPAAYVRWSEGRNMSAFLDTLATGTLRVDDLISHEFPVDQAEAAYGALTDPDVDALGVVLRYPDDTPPKQPETVRASLPPATDGTVTLGVIGVGNHVKDRLLPVMKTLPGLTVRAVCAQQGASASHAQRQFAASYSTTDAQNLLDDDAIDSILVGTRHASHAQLVQRALQANKHVLCEKPLCVTAEELAELRACYREADGCVLQVAFNRRHSSHVQSVRAFFEPVAEPLMMLYRVNAGPLPVDHWAHSAKEGGRIIGECCHFIDTMSAICGADPETVAVQSIDRHGSGVWYDKAVLTLRFANGSTGSLLYVADGAASLSKEYVEVHGGRCSAVIEDYRRTRLIDPQRTRTLRSRGQDKGFSQQLRCFRDAAAQGTRDPLAVEQAFAVSDMTIKAASLLRGMSDEHHR